MDKRAWLYQGWLKAYPLRSNIGATLRGLLEDLKHDVQSARTAGDAAMARHLELEASIIDEAWGRIEDATPTEECARNLRMKRDGVPVTLDPSAWEECGGDDDPASRLFYADGMTINGHWFHVEAIAVDERGEHREQVAADVMFADDLDRLQQIGQSALQTQQINGRDYVIHIQPHGT